ncbi:MAG TPA: Gfo/Idh/MocA family oxidoreductase [Cyclobacteriaceae bacterium]|nr:Gfo/Idh/MocA family oxidoreductase [Cyclobacteriaceae bacterium]
MISRREFLASTALSTAGLALSPMTSAASYSRIPGANQKTNIACVGIGNRGQQIIEDFEKTGLVNVVALCDVDMGAPQTTKIMETYPKAKRYQDFRELLDKSGSDFDAVTIATPDFSHFPIAMACMQAGKHVYVEKPLSRTFNEAELLMQMALKNPNLVTQVGNQGHSEANYFQTKAWVEAGIIKDVTAITAHMNSPRRWHKLDPNMKTWPEKQPIPSTMDWDTWLTTAMPKDYNELYHNGEWRCWYDFGMGALGDWGAHLIDTAHEFLELGLPYEVNPTYLEGHNDFFFPMSSTLLFRFGSRKGMPPVDLTWYDGLQNLPPLPKGFGTSEAAANVPTTNQGQVKQPTLNPGRIIYGKDLTFKGGSHGSTLSIIPEEAAKDMASKLPEVPKSPSNHFANFILACQGKEKTRSPFEINGILSQVFCLGVIAQRMNKPLYFDAVTKQITNDKFANTMLTGAPPRKEWEQYYKV